MLAFIKPRGNRKEGTGNRIKRSLEDHIMDKTIFVIMTFVLIVTLYPFYFTVILSFNDGLDAARGGIFLWPRVFTLDNYTQFLSDPAWIDALFVSIAKTGIGASLTVFFTCLVAFGLSQPELLFKRVYMIVLLVCMYFSGGLIPYFLVLRSLGLLNTFWVYVIPTMFSVFYCILAMSFFREIPRELYESATIDGARDITIFIKIILPVSKALLATLLLFAAVSQWNSWTDTAFFAPANRSLRTLSFLMREVINRNQIDLDAGQTALDIMGRHATVTSVSVQKAAMMIAIFPIICVYPFVQKHFVKGIMLGSVKG